MGSFSFSFLKYFLSVFFYSMFRHGCAELSFPKYFTPFFVFSLILLFIIFVKCLLVQILRDVCVSEALHFSSFFSLLFELHAHIIIFLSLLIVFVAISNPSLSPSNELLFYDYLPN